MPMQTAVQAPQHGEAARYVEQGFVVVENLLTTDEIAELQEDLVKLARGKYPSASLEPISAGVSDEEALRRILCIHQPHFVSPVVEYFTRHPRIADVLGQVVGAHLAAGHWDGSVKCMQSMFFAKPPGKPGQAWHQDEIFIPTRDRSLCGAWIAIDDATVDNGCLWVVPGSHGPGVLYPQAEHGRPDEFDVSPESVGFDDSAEMPVELRAGSVLFFNGYLLHRSRKNVSSRYRRALVSHYMTAQSLLPWEVNFADHSQSIGSADNRAVHMVCGDDPYADAGYVVPNNVAFLRQFGEE